MTALASTPLPATAQPVTAAMLPKGAQGVLYVSISGYATLIQRIAMEAMKGNGLQPQGPELNLPQFPKSPPLGIAVNASTAEIEVDLAVPPALVTAVGDYVNSMQNMFMQRQLPPAP